MLLIIIILYLFDMLMKIMFTFLANSKNMKFCMYLKFIKALILKFSNYIKIYNN